MDIDSIIKEVIAEICGKQNFGTAAQQDLEYSPASLAKYIDHTILKADASLADVTRICDEAKKFNFASVCVNSGYIKFVAEYLQGSGVAPCCVVGFPLGAMIPEAKADEASRAVAAGAKEVDMVVNIGAIKSDDWKLVLKDIEGVVSAVKGRAIVKVIIEACLLTDEEKVKACTVSKLGGAHFVKTSTGFSTGGATIDDVKLMCTTVGPDIGVKASGGVRVYEDAVGMIKAGASRLGTSNGTQIVTGSQNTGAASSVCANCGACNAVCPTGRTTILKDKY
ncbi:deoxyribose-phosphate aldolase [Clostridia bacterium]|nr:deoxyribose-phosphate aldolase [Clostridia bacterium]